MAEKVDVDPGYQTDTETHCSDSQQLHQTKKTAESSASYKTWAFDVKDSRLIGMKSCIQSKSKAKTLICSQQQQPTVRFVVDEAAEKKVSSQ